jgi:hypothetical protein
MQKQIDFIHCQTWATSSSAIGVALDVPALAGTQASFLI